VKQASRPSRKGQDAKYQVDVAAPCSVEFVYGVPCKPTSGLLSEFWFISCEKAVLVFVCVCERERHTHTQTETDRDRQRQRESVCLHFALFSE
jgi:hypothetical protein